MALLKQEKKFLLQTNCGNGIAEIGKKNCDKLIVAMPLPKQGGKKNCDKLIVAMALPKQGKKKLWQCHCRNREKKKIVTT